jgi:hypothetical protein
VRRQKRSSTAAASAANAEQANKARFLCAEETCAGVRTEEATRQSTQRTYEAHGN